ncbi:MAG TPA: GH116 family glycosyl hydrolase, partial [Longimicrobiales bacterium]
MMQFRTTMTIATLLTISLTQGSPAQSPRGIQRFPLDTSDLVLTGPARPGVFVSDIGRRAAILGDEGGSFEVWTWPIKLVRDLRLAFKIPEYDEPIPGAQVAQRVITRPEGLTIVYSNAAFTVQEHVFVPLNEPGAIILLDVQTVRPLDVLVRMHADFNLAWPGSFGGGNNYWDEGRHAFYLSQGGVGLYSGFVGSPFATEGTVHPAHDAPLVPSQFTLRFDPKQTTTEFIPIVVAGGAVKRDSSWAVYNRLLASAPAYWREKVAHEAAVRDSMLTVHSPDAVLDGALQWAGINLDQALACNPDLGCGLVAGFGRAGAGNFRPGFAWYFGGDAAINSFAMSSLGQFELVRQGMLFAAKYQRADGKIAHEISHAAARLPWFTDYPYTWYHGDTTPFWILANYEYWLASGDDAYIRNLWPQIVKAFRWSASMDGDGDALMDIPKAGVGAIEVGGLGDDLHTDIYIAGVWIGALKGLRDMARVFGDAAIERAASALFEKASTSLEDRFWLPGVQRYAFGLLDTPRGVETNDALTIWPTTAISFNLLRPERADRMLAEIAGSKLTVDWGTRTLASDHRLYDALHYNNGTVWPFVTGFVALAHYRGHRAWSGWELIRDIARTTFDFSRGHNPELMSGQYYRPLDTAVPNQYFATSMLVTPVVRGLLGLEADAPRHTVRFAPHLPARWD